MGLHKQRMASVMSLPPVSRSARAAPALPSTLAGLVAWGEGSDLGADGTKIASWLNKTASGLDPAQATSANQPTVKANTINGQKAALFVAASSQMLSFPAGALGWFNNVAGITMLAVVQPVTAPNAQFLSASTSVSSQPRARLGTANTSAYATSGRILDADVSWNITGGTLTTGVPAIVGMTLDATQPLETLWVNGSNAATATAGTPGATSATNSAAIMIGSRPDGAAFYDGYLAAYAMWNVAYTRTQLAGVLNRWATLYGIPQSV